MNDPKSDSTVREAVTDPRVVPVDYATLRLVAELAMGTNGQATQFDIAPDGVSSIPGVTPPSDTRVQIPTSTAGRTGALRYVAVQARGAGNAYNVLKVAADAVFWSESAVEKFVLPYVASVFGPRAAQGVSWMQTAFCTAWRNARVQAIVHLAGLPEGEPAQLERMWGVLFVDDQDGLRMLPLPDFLQFSEADRPVEPLIPTVVLGAGTLPPQPKFLPTATQLRGMAEWASSLRDRPMFFLYNVVTGESSPATATLPPVIGDEIVVPAYTPPTLAGRVPPDGVWLQPDGPSSPVDVAEVGDAAFWSTGALERFLYPYYASAAGANALTQLIKLHHAWEGGGDENSDEDVYAIIHLPKSNWVSETGTQLTAEPLHGLGVLYATRGEAHRSVLQPLRTYLAARG